MDKNYQCHLNNLDVEASGLLGFFDSDNQYVIENDIIQELILSNKLIQTYENDKITATATVGEYKIDFEVYIQDGENNKKRAGLFVVEKCKLEFAKVVQTYVDSFVGDNNALFFVELKKRFHLYAVDESEGIDMANSNLTKIINKKSDITKKYKTYIPLTIDADMEYVKKMLALIKTSTYGQNLLLKLKEDLNNKKIYRTNQNYWRELRLVLDKLLLENQSLFSPEIWAKIENLQQEYLKKYANTKEPTPKEPTKSGKGGGEKVSVDPPKYTSFSASYTAKKYDKVKKEVTSSNALTTQRHKPTNERTNYSNAAGMEFFGDNTDVREVDFSK